MEIKHTKSDNRPRFGWTTNLDNDPQVIFEAREYFTLPPFYVVVIPLPDSSSKTRAKVRAFVKKELGLKK